MTESDPGGRGNAVCPIVGKFRPARTHVHGIGRTRLLAELDDNRRPVTAITAPAGWGKTMLASQLASRRQSLGEHAIWLTADRYDDVTELWVNLYSATGYALGESNTRLEEVAVAQAGSKVSAVVDRWLGAMGELSRPVTLFIDDLHLVRERDAMQSLVRAVSLAPVGLELVLIARHDLPLPLHQWRMQELVAELRAADLAVGTAEAAQLLLSLDVRLEPDQLELLVSRTQGWIGGIRLAGHVLASSVDPARTLRIITGRTPAANHCPGT